MPESEKSYPDRVQKSRELHAACVEFNPVYTPPATGGVTMVAFENKINVCDELNDSVSGNSDAWSESVEARITVAGTIKPTTTQLLNHIKSSTTWKTKFPAAKRYADAIRGIKTPRKPPAPPAPGEPAAKARERGGQSYAELEKNWRGLVTLAIGLAGFAPPDVKIQAGTISGLLSQIKGLNGSIPTLEAALSEAQVDREKAFYEEELGLADMFQAVKTTVKGQYGTASTQWAQVKGMKW